MNEKLYYVYIMTNPGNTVLCTGVTNDIARRIGEHRNGSVDSFTKKYHIQKLVYLEACGDIHAAIEREKQLKGGSRQKKIQMIERTNPSWSDLSASL